MIIEIPWEPWMAWVFGPLAYLAVGIVVSRVVQWFLPADDVEEAGAMVIAWPIVASIGILYGAAWVIGWLALRRK